MQRLSSRLCAKLSPPLAARPSAARVPRRAALPQCTQRSFAKVGDVKGWPAEISFTSSPPGSLPDTPPPHEPLDDRKVKLGKTIRILHDRLPTLLATPLPQEILSPQISLRLFPSTHPHLPTVSGRIAYTAALWTSPVAWGRMPVVGNVKLIILSERMMRGASSAHTDGSEKLVVRWKTCGKTRGEMGEQIGKMMAILGRGRREAEGEFHGLFVFEFDEEGRVRSHTIEHVEEGNDWERTATVVSVTDWLLGKAWGKGEGMPGLAMCEQNERRTRGKE